MSSVTNERPRVLVVDDSSTMRRSAEMFLAKCECDLLFAQDGFDALAKVVDHDPDLIFIDVMMPRLDGYQTCALIKRNPRYQDTPVVMLTSKDGVFDRARGRSVGCDEYLTKPFTRESIVAAVRQYVNR
jgi:twitching motility two-component system response regulator PilG